MVPLRRVDPRAAHRQGSTAARRAPGAGGRLSCPEHRRGAHTRQRGWRCHSGVHAGAGSLRAVSGRSPGDGEGRVLLRAPDHHVEGPHPVLDGAGPSRLEVRRLAGVRVRPAVQSAGRSR